MTLENIFYVMGIIFMSVMFIIMIGIIVLIFYIKKRVDEIHQTIDKKIEQLVRPAESVINKGSAVAESAIDTVRKIMKKGNGK